MKFLRLFVGIGMFLLGIALYPYFVRYIVVPLTHNDSWETTYFFILPFGVLMFLAFCGVMKLLGKASGTETTKETKDK